MCCKRACTETCVGCPPVIKGPQQLFAEYLPRERQGHQLHTAGCEGEGEGTGEFTEVPVVRGHRRARVEGLQTCKRDGGEGDCDEAKICEWGEGRSPQWRSVVRPKECADLELVAG